MRDDDVVLNTCCDIGTSFDNSCGMRDYLIRKKHPDTIDEINEFFETDLGIHECELFDTANCRACPVANCVWQGHRFKARDDSRDTVSSRGAYNRKDG